MDWSSLGLAAVASSTSGLNLYATVLTLGLMQRFGWLRLPAQWSPLSHTWVLALAAVFFVSNSSLTRCLIWTVRGTPSTPSSEFQPARS